MSMEPYAVLLMTVVVVVLIAATDTLYRGVSSLERAPKEVLIALKAI